jgi:hypothetical protein
MKHLEKAIQGYDLIFLLLGDNYLLSNQFTD